MSEKKKEKKTKFNSRDLARTAEMKKKSKEDTTNRSYKLFMIEFFLSDTIPNYHTNDLVERYKEALLQEIKR